MLNALRDGADIGQGKGRKMGDLIDKQAALDFKVSHGLNENGSLYVPYADVKKYLEQLPSAEPLTDNEKRIFLAAMGREEKVCKEIDKEYARETYEYSLMWICKEIKRKVKATLWGQDCKGEVNK